MKRAHAVVVLIALGGGAVLVAGRRSPPPGVEARPARFSVRTEAEAGGARDFGRAEAAATYKTAVETGRAEHRRLVDEALTRAREVGADRAYVERLGALRGGTAAPRK